MITDEHFEALRHRREAGELLRLTCTAFNQSGSLLHTAYDRSLEQRPSPAEETLLRHLRAVK